MTQQVTERGTTDRPLPDLLSDLMTQMTTLVRQEVDLARTEMTTKASRAGRGAAMVGAGGAVAYAGFLALVAAIIGLLIEAGLDLWIAALIVGIVLAAIGGFLAYSGQNTIKRTSLAPERTIQTLQDDAEWVRGQTR
jgi:hypothetical protein